MKNKRCIIKVLVMISVISLIGINYGYWSEKLTLNGEASLILQVSIVDLVRTETVTKNIKPIHEDKQSEDNKVPDEENIDSKGKEDKEPSTELPEDSSDTENIDLENTEGIENEESLIEEEVNEGNAFAEDKSFVDDTSFDEDIVLEEDNNSGLSETGSDTEDDEFNNEDNLEIDGIVEGDKYNQMDTSNNSKDRKVDVDTHSDILVDE